MKPPAPQLPAEWLALGLLFALSAALLVEPVMSLTLHNSPSQNEGWGAYHALAAARGAVLYPPPDSLISNNYPPLWFYTLGAFARSGADLILVGRVLAMVSMFVVAACLYALTRWAGGDRTAALLATGLFLLYTNTHYRDFVGTNEPQWFGQALVSGGAVLFLARPAEAGIGRIALAALLMVLGGLAKHNLVGLPLAVLCWSALHDRRGGLRLLLSGTALAAVALGAILAVHGVAFLTGLLEHSRVISVAYAIRRTLRFLPHLLPYLVYGLLFALPRIGQRAADFLLLYLGWSAVSSVIFLGGIGVSYNVMFDLVAGAMLGTGLLFHSIMEKPVLASLSRSSKAALLIALCILPEAYSITGSLHGSMRDIERLPETRRTWDGVVRSIAAADGPVVCQTLSLCYWAGKPEELDVFNTLQKVETGAMPLARLQRLFEAKHFAMIQAMPAGDGLYGFPDALTATIRQNYREAVRIDDLTVLLVPRAAGQTSQRHHVPMTAAQPRTIFAP